MGALVEDLPVGPEADAGTGFVLGEPLDPGQIVAGLEGRAREVAGHPFLEREFVGVAVTVDLSHQFGGQGVDHRGPYTVEATRCAVGATTELASGMQLGQDDLQR